MNEIEIRPTIPADLDALADVLVQVHATDGYPVEGVDDPKAWVNLSDSIGQWTGIMDRQPVAHAALMHPDPGSGASQLFSQKVGVPEDRIAVLARLFVAPDARGWGIAGQLLDVAEAAAIKEGLALVLDVMAKDRAAIRLYQSRGWALMGSIEHAHSDHRVEPALAFALNGSVLPQFRHAK